MRVFDGRMAFVPEGQADSSLALSALTIGRSVPCPEGASGLSPGFQPREPPTHVSHPEGVTALRAVGMTLNAPQSNFFHLRFQN
jgi:hypothetical protein